MANVYKKNGTLLTKAHTIEYNGEHMGSRNLIASFTSPTPIDFNIGDYIVYRGEKFVLNVTPSITRQARSQSNGAALKYDSVKFNSLADELTRCMFLDTVTDDNGIHYYSLPDFSFYCENVTDLAERLQANLDRVYKDDDKWTVCVLVGENKYYYGDGTYSSQSGSVTIPGKTDISVSISKNNCWEALAIANSQFECDFIVKGKVIYIGQKGSSISSSFSYGKGNGLLTLDRSVDDSQNVITRLRAYGNTRNMPSRYYANLGEWNVRVSTLQTKADGFTYFEFDLPYSDKYFENKIRFSVLDYENVKTVYAERVEDSWKVLSGASYLSASKRVRRFTYGINPGAVPSQYYDQKIPNNLSVNRLMLPGYPNTSLDDHETDSHSAFDYSDEALDPYIDAKAEKQAIGVREHTIYFDGSDSNLDDIYPTLENITFGQIRSGGNEVHSLYNDEDYADVIKSAEQITDNGVLDTSLYTTTSTIKASLVYNSGHVVNYNLGKLDGGTYKFAPATSFATLKLNKKSEGNVTYHIRCYMSSKPSEKVILLDTAWTPENVNDTKIIKPNNENITLVGGTYLLYIDVTNIEKEGFGENDYAFVSAFQSVTITKSQVIPSSFHLTLKDIGFNIEDYVSENPTIHMKSGMCVGRDFEILSCTPIYDSNNKVYEYDVKCKRQEDSSLNLAFPYKDYNITSGDKFVISGIYMPDVYVDAAAKRLLEASKVYLSENCSVAYKYNPKVDNIYMQREYDSAISNGITPLHDKICEGDIITLEDSELIPDGISVTIDKLTIKESEGSIPQYTISLRDDKEVTLIQKIQNKLEANIKYDLNKPTGSDISVIGLYGTETPTDSNVYSSLKQDSKFLSKDKDDSTNNNITLGKDTIFGEKNFVLGSSGTGFINSNNVLQVENLKVLNKVEANEVSIQEVNYVGGTIVLTPANGFTVTKVEEVTNGYKLYFDNYDDKTEIKNMWKYGDLAFSERWDTTSRSMNNHRWWREVINLVTDYDDFIIVSKLDCEAGSSVPQVGDKVVMLGSMSGDSTRENAIMLSASQNGSPYIRQYRGINQFDLSKAELFVDLSKDRTYISADEINIKSSGTGQSTSVGSFIDLVDNALDGSFNIWYAEYEDDPTSEKEPLSTWISDGTAKDHVGDFIITTNGKCFKLIVSGSVYSWQSVSDIYLNKFVTSIDSKSTVFSGNNFPIGYKTNDIWVNATYTDNNLGKSYDNEILVCISTSNNNILDWQIANDYKESVKTYTRTIEQIIARSGINADGKVENYFVDTYSELTTESAKWNTEELKVAHLGDLGYVKPDATNPDGVLWEWYREGEENNYTYLWGISGDAITKNIIKQTSEAQKAADGKVTTYIWSSEHTSVPSEAQEGDLWVRVNSSYNKGNKTYTYNNDTLVCTHTYTEGQADIEYWSKIADYASEKWVSEQGFLTTGTSAKLYASWMKDGFEYKGANNEDIIMDAFFEVSAYTDGSGKPHTKATIKAESVVVDGNATFTDNVKIQGNKLVANNVDLSGKIVATSGEFKGTVKANAIYFGDPITRDDGSNSIIINPQNETSCIVNGFGKNIVLPSANDYVGLEYTIYAFNPGRTSVSSTVTTRNNREYIQYNASIPTAYSNTIAFWGCIKVVSVGGGCWLVSSVNGEVDKA